jgi:hypothetical protein
MAKRKTKAEKEAEQAAAKEAEDVQAEQGEGPPAKDDKFDPISEAEDLPNRKYENIFEALAAAQSSIKAIFRDAKHPKFGAYTSGENMIAVSRTVLNKHGLAVVPGGDSITKIGDGGLMIKENKYILGHGQSGQTVEGSSSVVIEEPPLKRDGTGLAGTWQDAALKADTIALSYYLRSVLQLPRYDKDKHVAGLEPKAEHFETPQPLAVSPAGKIFMDDAKVNDIRRLIEETQSDEAKMLKYYDVKGISLLSKLQYEHLQQVLNTKLEAGNIARETGGKVVGMSVSSPPQATPVEPSGGEQKIAPQFVHLIKTAVADKGKNELDLLAHLVVASIEDIPAIKLNDAMAWIRA